MGGSIGILGGTGPEGNGLAKRWAAAGEHIVIGSREAERAAEFARLMRDRMGGTVPIEGAENAAVVSRCEIIVITVPFTGHAALLKQLKPLWRAGQVVIDTTVPLAAAVGGSASHMLGVWEGSAAEQTREHVPPTVGVAAAFHNVSAEILGKDEPVDSDILVCSNDDGAKQVAMDLVGKISGARAVNGGKLENARIAESLTALLIGLNTRYKVHTAGIRFTGLPL